MHLLYLHGFLSSPTSLKAKQTKTFVAEHYPHIHVHTPLLSGVPHVAVEQAEQAFKSLPSTPIGIIGSSMGGFLAGIFAEKYDVKAALINPAVAPHLLFPDYIGEHTNPYTNEQFCLDESDISSIEQHVLHGVKRPKNVQVYLGDADEVLDYRAALAMYQDSECHVTQGNDHAYPDFPQKLPAILDFFLSP